jgi:predicted dehydrogenase
MVNDKAPETIAPPVVGNGFNYQIDEVARCIAAGKRESDIMPLDETLSIMKLLDDIRKQWGLKYPIE